MIRRPSVATERRQEEVRNGGVVEVEEEAGGVALNSHSSSLHGAEMILLTPEL